MQPSPNRNRQKAMGPRGELTHDSPRQLPKKQCAQKELNLQPASSGEDSSGRNLDFPAPIRLESAEESRTRDETAKSNRHQSVTETSAVGSIEGGEQPAVVRELSHGRAPARCDAPSDLDSQQPFALSGRPDLLGDLDGRVLAARLGLFARPLGGAA